MCMVAQRGTCEDLTTDVEEEGGMFMFPQSVRTVQGGLPLIKAVTEDGDVGQPGQSPRLMLEGSKDASKFSPIDRVSLTEARGVDSECRFGWDGLVG